MSKLKFKIIHPGFLRRSALLLTLIVIIFINPFLDEIQGGRLISSVLVFTTIASAFAEMFSQRMVIWFAVVVVVLSLIIEVLSWTYDNAFFMGVIYLRNSVVYGIFALILFYYMLKIQPLSFSEIGNAISIYLLAGLSFGYVYSFFAQYHPMAFSHPAGMENKVPFDMIYYSFITLTTTGYGDIQPLMRVPRLLSIIETIFGTFYIAVIIGRLVGLAYQKNPSPD